jgi:hypothetical protein
MGDTFHKGLWNQYFLDEFNYRRERVMRKFKVGDKVVGRLPSGTREGEVVGFLDKPYNWGADVVVRLKPDTYEVWYEGYINLVEPEPLRYASGEEIKVGDLVFDKNLAEVAQIVDFIRDRKEIYVVPVGYRGERWWVINPSVKLISRDPRCS